MLKKIVLFSALAVLAVGSAQAFDAFIPERTTVEAPAPDVPPVCAGFSSDTGWVGYWKGSLSTNLVVTKVNPDCSFKGTYAWGNSGTLVAGYMDVSGKINPEKRTMYFYAGSATLEFYLQKAGDKLEGSWSSGARSSNAVLQKGTVNFAVK